MGLFSDAWEKQKKKSKQSNASSGGLFSSAWELYKQNPDDYASISKELQLQRERLTAQRRGGVYDPHRNWLKTINGMTDEQIRSQVQGFRPSGESVQDVLSGLSYNTNRPQRVNPYTADIAGAQSDFDKAQSAWLETVQKAENNPYVGKTDTARKWIAASSAARDATAKGYNTLVPNPAFDDEEYGYWKVIDDYVKANGMDPNGHLGYYDVDKDFYREGIAKYANTPDKTMTSAVSRGEREDAAYNAIRAKEYAQRLAEHNAKQDEWLKGVQAESDAAWAAMEEAKKGLDKAKKQKRLAGMWDYLDTTTGGDPFGMRADKQRMGRAFGILPEVGDDIKNSQERLKDDVAREVQNAKPLTEYEQWLTDYYKNNTLLGIDEQMAANDARIAELTTGQTYGQEQGSAYLRDAQTYEALKQQVAEGMSIMTFTPEQRELWNAYASGNGLEWSNNRYAKGNKNLQTATFENEVLAANRANIVQQRNYQAAAGQPDFKANSVRDEAQTDELYNFVNDNAGSKRRANEVFGIASTITPEGEWLDKGYGFLNRNEIAYYNYIVKTQGLEAGQRVLDELAPELALRRALDVAEDAEAFAKKYGGWSTLSRYGLNLVSGITAPLRAIDAIANPDHSYLSSMYDNQVFVNVVSDIRAKEWGKATDKWQISIGDWKLEFGPELGEYLYGLQASGGDMLIAMAVGKGVQLAGGSAAVAKGTVQAIMSSEAGGATMYRAMEQGVDPRKAVVLGLGSAAIEALTEKYSIEELLKKPDLIRTYLGQNMLTEATEEGASNLLNLAWDTMVLGNQGDIMTAYSAALEANGGDEQKAARTVLLDKLAELGLDVLGGAVMGGGMASLPAASTAVKRGKVGKTINTNGTYNQLRDIAAAMDKDTAAYKIASETTKDGKISNAQAGRLYSALMESLDERSAATIKEAQVREVTQRLRDLGESGNIGAAADAIQQLWMGRRLTGEQRRAIASTQYGQQVINELLGVDDAWAKGAIERVGQVRREGDMTTMRARHLASKSFRSAENAEASKLVAKDAATTYQNAAEETEYNAKTTVDGKEGEITGIKDVVDGAPVFTVQVGDQVQDVALADLQVDSYNMAAVADAMRGMTAQAANEMLGFYKASGINGAAFARGWKTAYNAGRTALGMEYVNTNGAASVLPQSAKETAYRAGEQQYQGEKPAARETAPKAPRGKGKVTFEKGTDLRTSKLTRGQRSAIGVTRMLAQVTGINFRFYQSTADKEGRYTGANGYYDPKTNTIALDLNAGKNSATDKAQFAILRTASHELTHHIARNSQDMYRRLQTFVLDNLIKRGKSMDLLIADQIARAKENGITLSEAEAIEEVVADACEMMLRDSKAIETLAEKDHGLFVHIRNWLRKFYGQLKQAFDGLGASRAEALGLQDKDADGIMRYIDGLQELWDQALVDAVEGGRASVAQEIVDQSVSEYKQENKGEKFSLRQIDGMTEKRYNKYGWAVVNDVLTRQEQVRFLSMFETYGVKGKDKTFDGNYLVNIWSDDRDVYIVTDGRKPDPSYERIYVFSASDRYGEEYERVMEVILYGEIRGNLRGSEDYEDYQRAGLVTRYDRENQPTYSEAKARYRSERQTAGRMVRRKPGSMGVRAESAGRAGSDQADGRDGLVKNQARDYSALSERDILAGADPNAVKNAGQRQYLTEYQKSVRHLINLNDRLTKYQQEYIDAGDRNAQIEAKNRIDVVTGQIQRQEEKLAKMEARPDFQPALQLARQTLDDYLAKTDAGQIAKDIESTQDEYRKTLLTKASAAKERLERTKERMRDTQSRSALRDRIKRKVHDLNKLLTKESDTKHVPQELKAAAAEFLKAFTNDTSVFAKGALDDLRYAYDRIREENVDEVGAISQLYDRDIAVIMDTLRPTIDGKRLSELTQQETQDVLDMVEYFSHIIKSANSIFLEGRSASISALGKESIDRAESEKRFKGADNPVVNLLRSGMMTPAYFFKKLGGAMKKLYDDLKAGEMRWARLEQDARRFFVQTAEKYHYWDWSNVKNDVLTIQTQEGHDITLTREQALGLYATWRRENSDNGQQAGHLSQGGFVYENAMEQNKKTKEITVDTSKPNRMTDVDMAKVSSWLTDEQRAYADEMVRYMSEDMAALGNEVSMTLFGIKKYGEKYYFPYQSSQNYIYTPLGSGAATNDQRLKHSSFTNRTVQFANNPIIASDFTTVWANHVNHMILYGSMCVPLENFNRVYNYKYKEIDEETGEVIGPAKSVKAALEGAYGKQALKYIETLMTDLNGGMRTQTDGVAGWLTSKFKKNAVFASMSVVAQQPSAIVRAMALVDPKYFAPGIAQRGSWDELMKYSGTAIIKDMGGFDTATGRTTRDWLIHKDPKGLKEKGKELVNVKDGSYRDEVLSYLPAKADQIAWTHLWRAVKAETAANNPGLTGDAFLEEAARRFDEVVSYTQVYDSVLAKSQIMRSKDGASKMVTAFMAEPTVAYNLLYDAFANRGKTDSVGRTRAVTAYVATAVVNALLKSIVTAARDDEDKSYGEKYLGELVENVVNDVNPVNLVPYARDVWSIFQGYDVERADMSIISDLKGSLDKIMDEDATPDVIIKEIATTAGAFLGLPVKNVWRDVAAVGNVFNSASIPFSPEGARYAMLEALPFYDGRTSAYYGRLLDAYIDGNTSEQESLNLYLTTTLGKSEKTVKTQTKTELGKRYKAGKISEEDAIEMLTDYFGVKDTDAYWTVKEWREKAEFDKTNEDEDEFKFTRTGELQSALASGNNQTINAAKDELVKNGYTEKSVQSDVKSEVKNLYKQGKINFATARKLLETHGSDEFRNKETNPEKKKTRQQKLDNEWYWLEQEYNYAKANYGKEGVEAWNKYDRLDKAIDTGRDLKAAAKELLDHGSEKSNIGSHIKNKYKDTYASLYKTNKTKALSLLEKIVDAYIAIGYKDRKKQAERIKKEWLE